MAQFRNILFPIDFSPSCQEAAPHVVAMAQRFNSRVTVLNVLALPTAQYVASEPAQIWTVPDIDELKKQQQPNLETFVRDYLPDLDVRSVAAEGEAARVITELAEKDESDLVMMPTRGMGPFRRYLIGSVTAKVLHDCSSPVWTSAHRDNRSPPASGGPVLCAVNLQAETPALLRFAAEFATSCSTTLSAVHVNPAVDELSENRGLRAVREHLFGIARDEWKDIRISADVDADLTLAGGDIARGVANAAEKIGAAVVVIARAKMQKPLGGLRTQAYAIIRESPCPVIAV